MIFVVQVIGSIAMFVVFFIIFSVLIVGLQNYGPSKRETKIYNAEYKIQREVFLKQQAIKKAEASKEEMEKDWDYALLVEKAAQKYGEREVIA